MSDARRRVPARVEDHLVEGGVRLDERRGVVGVLHPAEAVREPFEVLVGEPRSGEPRRLRLEQSADLVDLDQRADGHEIAHEADPGQQQLRLERRDVGAVADARLEDADQRERARRLTQRAPRDAEPLRQLPLRRQARARRELPGADQLLDLRDRLVCGAAGAHVRSIA